MIELNEKYKSHRIQIEIIRLRKELLEHQEKCKHKNVEQECGSNTGNFDPSSDCYWVIYNCPVCLKNWAEYQ
jgi:hypothetical protein